MPLWLPAGILRLTGPPRVGTWSWVPRAVGAQVDLQVEVAGGAAREAWLALAGEADLPPLADAGGDAHLEGAVLKMDLALGVLARGFQAQFAGAASEGLLQADLDPRGLVLAALAEEFLALPTGAHAAAAGVTKGVREAAETPTTEEGGKEVAEAAGVAAAGAVAELAVEAALPGGRPELLAGAPLTAQGLVGGALFPVLEDLVGLVDLLEARFGVGLLAHVRVVFARQLAVGLFDGLRRGVARDTEGLVIVFVLHGVCRPNAMGRVSGWRLGSRS